MTNEVVFTLAAVVAVSILLYRFRQDAPDRHPSTVEEALSRAEQFDLSAARTTYRRDRNVGENHALQVEAEFKRLFALIAINPGQRIAIPGGPVDDYWHALILNTALYERFTYAVAGQYIHHWPAEAPGKGGSLAPTRALYEKSYGRAPSDSAWGARSSGACGNVPLYVPMAACDGGTKVSVPAAGSVGHAAPAAPDAAPAAAAPSVSAPAAPAASCSSCGGGGGGGSCGGGG